MSEKFLNIMFPRSLWKHLIFAMIYLHEIYSLKPPNLKVFPLLARSVSLSSGMQFMLKCFVIVILSVIYDGSLIIK